MKQLWMVMAVFLLNHHLSVALLSEQARTRIRVMTAKERDASAAEVAQLLRDQQLHRSRRAASNSARITAADVMRIRHLVEEERNKMTDNSGSRTMAEEIAYIRNLIKNFKEEEKAMSQTRVVKQDSSLDSTDDALAEENLLAALVEKPNNNFNSRKVKTLPVRENMLEFDETLEERDGASGDIDSLIIDNNGCHDWQMYDPPTNRCVCAQQDNCGYDKGLVCDDQGTYYQSECSFSYSMCSGQISTVRKMQMCSDCEYIKLRGASVVPEDSEYGLGIFRRVLNGNSVEFEAIDGSDFRVWKIPELQKWVVGIRNESGSFINLQAYVLGGLTDPLLISRGGFCVLIQNDNFMGWDPDPLLHFECIDETDITSVDKRFIFTALVVIAVVATATAVTLNVVQAERGCLYFPEVCRLRDEIEDTLKPRVEAKQAAFIAKYGDASMYKDNSIACYGKTNDLRHELITVQELQNELGAYVDSALGILTDIPNLEFDFSFGYAVDAHIQYQEGLGKQAEIGIVLLEIEIGIAAYTLATTATVSTAALAFAAIGAVVAIFIAVADIIKSINQEEEIRDTLRDNKRDLLAAESDIDTATAGMITLQQGFCRELLVPLSKMSQAGAAFSLDFLFFMLALESSGTFVTEESMCNYALTYEAITSSFLTDTLLGYLDNLIAHVQADIQDIRDKIEEAKLLQAFANALRDDVLINSRRPSDILEFAQENKPDVVDEIFNNEYELLVYLAKNLLADRSCYWGITLEPFRTGIATVANYQVSSIVQPCDSSEISAQTAIVASDVADRYRPCKILNRMDPEFIRDASGLMHYIANIVLPTERCYWGFDLDAIRAGTITDAQLNAAELSFFDFRFIAREDVTPEAYDLIVGELCQYNGICNNTDWVDFLLCMVDSSWASAVGSCAGVPNRSSCSVNRDGNSC